MNEKIVQKEILRHLKEIKQDQIQIKNLLDVFIPDELAFSELYNKYNVPKSTAMNFLKNVAPEYINKKGAKIYVVKNVAFEFIQRYSNGKTNKS